MPSELFFRIAYVLMFIISSALIIHAGCDLTHRT
jgi:hypothetical protein